MQVLSEKLGAADIEQLPTRNGFGDALVELAEKNLNVVALTGDLSESTRVQAFQQKFPERFFEVGVAEQNMMGIAAGLALSGKIPFVTSYATFSPGRNWDQLRVSVCYSKANVKIIGAHTGVSVGPDGATHQALEDIAITRVLPNLIVVVPCDYQEAKKATLAIGDYEGPAYLRITREKTPVFTRPESNFEIGKAEVLQEGADVAIIGCGPILYNALLAAKELAKEGVSAMVINNHTVKPIDEKVIISAARKCGAIVTVEEHQIAGGAGSAICEVLAKAYPVPVEMIGMPDTFGQSGQPEELMREYGMDVNAIVFAAKKVILRKDRNVV